jgi:putative MATE family efflux protein
VNKDNLLFSNKDLWLLIWPLLVEQLLQITLGMADIVMVASLGEAAVSGVSLVDAINVLLTQIFAALATGGAVVCSQYIGSGRFDMANKTAKQLLYTITAVALVLLLVGVFFYKPILRLIFGNVADDVMAASRTYFIITLYALPGIAVYNGAAALFRAQGNSKISMLIALLVNILNIGGNALMVYGMKLGVEGVAIPTLVSRTAAAVILLICLRFPREKASDSAKKSAFGTAISIQGIRHVEIDWHLVKKILQIGVPNGLENSTFQIGKILVLSLISSYGTTAIAANAAGNTLASFEVLPGNAAGLAMLTVVGQCMGAGKTDQAQHYTKKLMTLAYAGFWLLNIPLLLCSYKILTWYGMSEETTKLAWYMTLTHGLCGMLIWPLSFTLPNALRAANDATFTMVVSMCSMWLIRVGMSYVFKWTNIFGIEQLLNWPVSFGALGVWFAMIIDWVVRSSFFVARFAGGKWKTRKLI